MRIFEIVLENPPLAYTGGDMVEGKVVLQSDEDEAVGFVSVTFSGRGKTKLTKGTSDDRHTYRGRAPLFSQATTLYSGHYTLRASRYEWPFKFTFPSCSDPTCIEDTFNESSAFLCVGQVHPLPPSFNEYDNRTRRNDQGMVEYQLYARLERPADAPRFHSSPIEHNVALNYLPLRPEADPDYNCFVLKKPLTVRSLRLLPDKQELTLREKLHSIFKKNELPSATFLLQCTYPTQTFPGRPLPVQFSVLKLMTTDNVPIPPVILLRDILITIKSYFDFRAVAVFNDVGSEISREYTLLDAVNTDLPIPVRDLENEKIPMAFASHSASIQLASECLDINVLKEGGLLTPSICPNFTTINVAVKHKLKVKAKIFCASKEFDFDLAAWIRVLSSLYDGNTRPGRKDSAAGPGLLASEQVSRFRSPGDIETVTGKIRFVI